MKKANAIAPATALVLALGLGACGGRGYEVAVVRVGGTVIRKGAVEHWSSAILRGAVPITATASSAATAKERAVAFLISAEWLIEEAAQHGASPSKGEIERRVHEEVMSAGLHAEFAQRLAEVGETLSDAGFEARVGWAVATLQGRLAAQVATMTKKALRPGEVGEYYAAHIAQYTHPELREFDLAEPFSSVGAARAFIRRYGTGARFSKIALHERTERPKSFDQPNGKGPLLRAIFSAKPGTVGRPMWLNRGYVVFVLRHIKPRVVDPLRKVRATIEAHLLAAPKRQALAELLTAYERKWTARTNCSPGYVVPKCRQYRGPVAAGEHLLRVVEGQLAP